PAQFEASKPLLDLAAGYVRRAEAQMPRQTDTDPWTLSSNYFMEIRRLKQGQLDDPALQFARLTPQAQEAAE
ncbi:MAG: hypothetical protein OIF40_01365, partial [Mangrovicoccus sp.]|nr:hypothetical protein [Mangrovicoccus sp.]